MNAPELSPAEARIVAAFESAPTPPEVREAAVVEEVEEATRRHFGDDYRGPFAPIDGATKLAQAKFRAGYRAAVAAYRAAQDGGAEEAVRRVEALTYASDDGTEYEHNGHGIGDGEPECPGCWVDGLRVALAPQADR